MILLISALILISGCIEQVTITRDNAISTASQTEEVMEFLKTYPSADISFSEDAASMTVTYSYQKLQVKIALEKATGRILSKYPKLEYLKSRTYCEKNEDCVPASSRCACVNFMHVYPPEGIVEEMCGPSLAVSECVCENNQCIGMKLDLYT